MKWIDYETLAAVQDDIGGYRLVPPASVGAPGTPLLLHANGGWAATITTSDAAHHFLYDPRHHRVWWRRVSLTTLATEFSTLWLEPLPGVA